jgi:hypothetical protein
MNALELVQLRSLNALPTLRQEAQEAARLFFFFFFGNCRPEGLPSGVRILWNWLAKDGEIRSLS